MRVAVLDLGLGNLLSIKRGLERAGAEVAITAGDGEGGTPKDAEPDAVVLPGVGAFRDATNAIGRFNATMEQVRGGKPLLGVCLGMQLLFTKSYEGGEYPGLDLIRGEVVRLPDSVKVPQMGWNAIRSTKDSLILKDVIDGEFFYFVHSYYCRAEKDVVVAYTEYGVEVPAIVESGNVLGTQFHPEKSGRAGLTILKNFLEAARR
jgi:glutamine amidotransferase